MRLVGIVFIVLASLSTRAAAFTPESGFYVVPGAPGTGLAIEINNQRAFVAGYVYDAEGRPTFVTAQGEMFRTTDDAWQLDSPLYVSRNGQCIGSPQACPYRAPATTAEGTAQIRMLAENLLELRWSTSLGEQVLAMERGALNASDFDSLLGEWDIVIDQLSDETFFIAEKLKFTALVTSGGAITGAVGCIVVQEGSPGCGPGASATITREPIEDGGFRYTIAVRDTATGNVVRRYRFASYGRGGQFSQTFKGTKRSCGGATTDPATCVGTDVRMVGYKSASRQYAIDAGNGMD